jgi:hypothetical protein
MSLDSTLSCSLLHRLTSHMKLPVSIKTNNVVQTKAFPQSAIKSPPMLGKSQLAKEILVLGIKV